MEEFFKLTLYVEDFYNENRQTKILTFNVSLTWVLCNLSEFYRVAYGR